MSDWQIPSKHKKREQSRKTLKEKHEERKKKQIKDERERKRQEVEAELRKKNQAKLDKESQKALRRYRAKEAYIQEREEEAESYGPNYGYDEEGDMIYSSSNIVVAGEDPNHRFYLYE